MITCPICRSRELEGELFCSECGARLGAGPVDQTLTGNIVEVARAGAESPRVTTDILSRLRAGQIALSITDAAQPLILEGRSEYILGREGHDQVVPDLNLNPFGAREKGVSRVHAALRRDHSQVLLIDLGSTNGTRLNGRPVAAHQAVKVANGDEIRLGKLLLRINFGP
ncbi:MAG: FHA domain-containing protein [Anaerolineales bacterium]|nr:FHA domain-containing protein [Anaerolineales bacterium]